MPNRAVWLMALAALCLPAQDWKLYEKSVTSFALPNGMRFLVLERHAAPTVSLHLYVAGGSANDPAGQSGLAYLLERMAFKGTQVTGTLDWAEEKEALAAQEAAWDRVDAERARRPTPDNGQLDAVQRAARSATSLAASRGDREAYRRLYRSQGATGLTAQASADAIEYACTLPANRLELWFAMESQRVRQPVFRDFYTERDQAREDAAAALSADSKKRVTQELLAKAFEQHPYRNPVTGWLSELETLRAPAAQAFFAALHAPANMTVAVVGDVNPAEVRRLAGVYFGPLPAGAALPRAATVEPPQTAPRTAPVAAAGQPWAAIGYRRPDQYHADDMALDAVALLLGNGRPSLLYQQLVEQQRAATQTQAIPTLPGGRYPGLFVLYAAPARNRSVEETVKGMEAAVASMRAAPVSDKELARVKAEARTGAARQLESNAATAALLAKCQSAYGDWRRFIQELDGLAKLTTADVQRAAQTWLIDANRTTAYTTAPGGRR